MIALLDSALYTAPMKLNRQFTAQASGVRVIDLIATHVPELSRQQIKQAMQKGAVWFKQGKHEKRLRRATRELRAGETIAMYYDSDLLSRDAGKPTLVSDEKEYSVWIKPAGLLSQGTKYGDHCSLLHFAEQHFRPSRACYLVHRLDSGASGLMLVAHNSRAAAAFSDMFQKREMTKRYHVTVEGLLYEGVNSIREPLDDKEAITHIEKNIPLPDNRSDLIVRIETGRKHQIRRHLSLMGHPVIGDKEYGSSFTKEPLQLVATALSFVCPLTQKQKNYFLPNAAS